MRLKKTFLVIAVVVALAAGLGLGLARVDNPFAATDITVAQDVVDPYAGYSLWVEWDGGGSAITAVSGLEWAAEVVTYKTVTRGGVPVEGKEPGAMTYTPMVIERGITDDMAFADWAGLVADGQVAAARREIGIVLYDAQLQEVARWILVNCWPSRYTTWIDVSGTDVPAEYLTLEYEGFTRAL